MPSYQFRAEAIHAHWPAYPAGHGLAYALETLCCFPNGTHFEELDRIDGCVLLIAVEYLDPSHTDDRFSDHHHHVALWASDIADLRSEAMLGGFKTGEELRRPWIDHLALMERDGRLSPEQAQATLDLLTDSEWEADADESRGEKFGYIAEGGFTVLPAGWAALSTLVTDLDLPEPLAARLTPLLNIAYLDAAVRDAAIILESDLRRRAATDQYGQKLITRYCRMIDHRAGGRGAFQTHVRMELRTLFKFVRNEFAHNIVVIEQHRCHALLRRIAAIFQMLDDADNGVRSFQDIMLGEAGSA